VLKPAAASKVVAGVKPVAEEDPKVGAAVVAGRAAPPAAPQVDPFHLARPVSIWCRAPLLRPLLSSFGTDDHLHRSLIYIYNDTDMNCVLYLDCMS
jgi:hypothetical protein